MSTKKKGGLGSLAGIFIREAPETQAPTTPVRSATASAPPLISTFATPAPATTNAGPSQRMLDILKAAQEQVPYDNAQFKLDAAMKSIEAHVPDTTKRREMALAMLTSQGITGDQVLADEKKARDIMLNYLNTLTSQLEEQRTRAVDTVRASATSLREKAGALDTEIARIRDEQTRLNTEAGELETSATAEEANLNLVSSDIESALALVTTGR